MSNSLVMAGIVATREFNLNHKTVKVEVVPSDSTIVVVRGERGGESVTLQGWRCQDGRTIYMAYSKLNNILVVRE